MFKIFEGFHLVEAYQKNRKPTRFKAKGYLKMLLCTLLSLVIAWLPTDVFGIDGLTVIEQRVIALFVFAATMWISEALPSWVTSFLVIVIMLLTVSDKAMTCFLAEPNGDYGQAVSYKSIMATLSDPTIMLFMGGFVLAICMAKTKVDMQLAKVLLKMFGTKSENVLLGFILVTALFSAFVSNTATAAMMLTFMTPVLKQLPAEGKGRIALAMAIPVGANIGGIATPIGTPPNTIALGYLHESMGIDINFGTWMLKMVPFVLIMLILGWIILRVLFPFTQKTIHLEIDGEMQKNKDTYVVIGTFLLTVFLWCFGDMINLGLNSYIIALIPIAIFAATGVFTHRDLEEINWRVLWMVAGGFALGLALNKTGLSKHLVEAVPFAEWSVLLIIIVSMLICFGFSNFISNSATASLLVPVIGVIAGAIMSSNGDQTVPTRMLIGIAIAASVSMILPISTPPNAIASATGMITQKDMMKVGILMGVLGLMIGLGWVFLVF